MFLGRRRGWAGLWDSAASQEEAKTDVTVAPVLADGDARGKVTPGVHKRDDRDGTSSSPPAMAGGGAAALRLFTHQSA